MQISLKLPQAGHFHMEQNMCGNDLRGGGLRSLTVFNTTFRIQYVYKSENILKTIFPASQNDGK